MILTVKPCPENIKPMQNLDLDKYIGTWHEMYRSVDTPSEGGECHTVHYSKKVKDNSISAIIFDLFGTLGNQRVRKRVGKLHAASEHGGTYEGQMSINFTKEGSDKDISYMVIHTDYKTYSIEYQCAISLGFQRVEYIWILTRVPTEQNSPLFIETENKVKDKMKDLFNTTSPGNEKYSDFKNYFESPDQGDDFCNYKKGW